MLLEATSSNKQHAGNNKLVARDMLLVARNKLLVRATCSAQLVALV